MSTNATFIVSAKRSPIGRFLGGLSALSATQIGTQVAKAVLAESQVDPAAVEEALIGMVLQAGAGQNPARQVGLAAGLPPIVSACTINKVCGSGLQSVMYADQVIRCGDADIILAGGIESMSQSPFLVREMRGGNKFGDVKLVDAMNFDGLLNFYDGDLMGNIAEDTAVKAGATRQMQDAFAARSHQRAAAAEAAGRFAAERVPIELRAGKGPLNTDETVRPQANADALSALKPAFKPGGSITAGNASPLSDGAAMMLVVGERALSKVRCKPLARIVAHTTTGAAPRELFFTPIAACRDVCKKAGWTLDSVDLWEINEAFAAEIIAVVKRLELDEEKLNVHGGAIALGHPLGASGARVLTTLLHALQARDARRGVAAMCLGGGNAVAMAVERV